MGNVCKRHSSSFTPRWAPRRSTPSRLSPAAILASNSSRVKSLIPTLYTRSQRVSKHRLSRVDKFLICFIGIYNVSLILHHYTNSWIEFTTKTLTEVKT